MSKSRITLFILLSILIFSCQKQIEKNHDNLIDTNGYIDIKLSAKYDKNIRVQAIIEPNIEKDTFNVGDTLNLKAHLKNGKRLKEVAEHEDFEYTEIFTYKTSSSEKELIVDKSNIYNDTAYVTQIVVKKTGNEIEKRHLGFVINTHFGEETQERLAKYDSFMQVRVEYYVK